MFEKSGRRRFCTRIVGTIRSLCDNPRLPGERAHEPQT